MEARSSQARLFRRVRVDGLMQISPTAARLELSRRIREAHQKRCMSVRDIADQLGITGNHWSQIENDRALIAGDKLDRLVEILDLDEGETKGLGELLQGTSHRGWWDDHLKAANTELLGLESGAYQIRTYETSMLSGLLQTQEYARERFQPDLRGAGGGGTGANPQVFEVDHTQSSIDDRVWRKSPCSGSGRSVKVEPRACSNSESRLVDTQPLIPGSTHLAFTAAEWDTFLDGVYDGEFGLLLRVT